MMMEMIDCYLIAVNVIGFLLFAVNMWLYAHTAKGQIDVILTAASMAGGSFGVLLAIFLFDRKAKKNHMMSRVFVVCIFVIQVIMLLFLKGHHADEMTFAFWTFFAHNKILTVYLCIVNVITFVVFAMDKLNAVKNRRRFRVVTLLGLAFAGGSLGGLLAMYIFRHKTQKNYFTIGIPLIIFMQMTVIFYMMNVGW